METRIGSVLDVDYGIIVHQCNAQGVMGSGIAKSIKARFPSAFDAYSRNLGPPYCQPNSGRDFLGSVTWAQISTGLWICNLVGQQFFGKEKKRYTSYDALDVGFEKVAHMAKIYAVPVHFPLIGCDRGGADWEIVSSIIEKRLESVVHTLWLLPE